jgi:hypothetical protein
MAAPASMSLAEVVGLACAVGFAGDDSGPGCGVGFPQPESRTASKSQQGVALFFLKIVCSVMGTKGFKQDNGPHQSGESSKLATKENGGQHKLCRSGFC